MANGNIADLSNVSPQRSILESRPERPSSTSTLYLRRFSTQGGDGRASHTVIGVHVILAKGDSNGLWESLAVDRSSQKIDGDNPKVATASLTICCDTLEIRGEFSLPEANVSIFARRLIWADDAASINTSPLSWTVNKARNASDGTPGQKGAEGRNAGSLQIFVRESTPAKDAARFVTCGGRGQDPGAGKDGTDGDWKSSYGSYPFNIRDSDISTSKRTVSFDPPAVYVEYEWRWGAVKSWGPGYLGENSWPKDGTDALAPGIPGNGGNGGSLGTNLVDLAKLFRNEGGGPGTIERDYRGGRAGSPKDCAKYKVRLWQDLFGTDNASFERDQTDKHTCKEGAPATAIAPSRGPGKTPTPTIVNIANAWLHPLGIAATFEYARDLFLAEGRNEALALLEQYQAALNEDQPDTDVWKSVPASEWTAAQVEVATMMQRLRAHLDYFGHPAGYTPLLSLPGSIQLYKDETKRALRMMLLTRWVSDADRDAREAGVIMTDALTSANDDSREAADQVAAGEKKITEVEGQIEVLRRQLTDFGNRLVTLRNNLLVKAENDLEKKAAIKFSIKMAGALCQIIPVGQPALGTVGSLAAVAADFVGGDPDSTPDTISKMGDVLTKASKAAGSSKEGGKEAKKQKDAAAPTEKKEAEKKSSAWATAGKGLGPSLSLVAEGVKALQAPKSEIDAELARLESQDPGWNQLTRDIRDLNEKKAVLFGDLADAIQSVGEGFSRMSSNASTIVKLQSQREKTVGKLDPEAVYAVRQLGQRSRLMLQKYLYLMVKSYESTLLISPSVDWNITNVTEKISGLLKPGGGFDAASLNSLAESLDILFQQNLSSIREQLLKDFVFGEDTTTLRLGLSAGQTPQVIDALNSNGRVVINPEEFGLLLPDEQLARLSGAVISKLTFDPKPSVPPGTNVIVSMVPARTGTMRRGDGLYVLASEAPVRWRWTYLSPTDIRPAEPSPLAKDVLNFVLGTGSEKIRQKVSLPPAWSDLTVTVQFAPALGTDERPRISELYFEMKIDSSSAPDFQRVLWVQPRGNSAGAVTSCSPDLAKRANGTGRIMRIYSAGDTVALSVPSQAGGAAFDGWSVIGARVDDTGLRMPSLQLKLDDHVLAVSSWALAGEAKGPMVNLSTIVGSANMAKAIEEAPAGPIRRALKARPTRPARSAIRSIRLEPRGNATIVGVISPDGIVDILEDNQEGWQLVNYEGVVGWVSAGLGM
jgi:hypothetical protein